VTEPTADVLHALKEAALWFGQRWQPRKLNMSASAAKAFTAMLEAARIWSVKTDEEWAAEVLAERERCARIVEEEMFLSASGLSDCHADVVLKRIRGGE
jgi:hypothetical protein